MFSGIFKLNWRDLVKGLTVAALAAFFTAVLQNIDTIELLKNPIVNVVVSSILAYLSKNLATDQHGKLGGKI